MQLDMLTSLDPAPRKLARREGPTTSRQAAERVREFAAQHREQILQVLRERGADGLTVHEIAAFCRLDAHAVGKRMKELEQVGAAKVLLDNFGEPRMRDTPTGRAARVWGVA